MVNFNLITLSSCFSERYKFIAKPHLSIVHYGLLIIGKPSAAEVLENGVSRLM